MATACDVARHLLEAHGEMSAMKLQKLVYYSQAWSLVWDERPMFDGRIEAWANGPVSPELYAAHRGRFMVSARDIAGDPAQLDERARETIEAVFRFYGGQTAQWLSELTHNEDPWRNARTGLGDGVRGNHEITQAAMAEYYGGL